MVPLLLVRWGGIEKAWGCSGKSLSPMKEPTIKEHLLIMMPRQNYLEKVGKASFKFKPREEVGQWKVI